MIDDLSFAFRRTSPGRGCRPPIFRKLALVAQLEIEAHRGVCVIRSGPALFEASRQAGYNPELVLDLPDPGNDIGPAAFICLTPLLPPLHRRRRRIFELQPIRVSGRSDSASPTAWRRCFPKPIRQALRDCLQANSHECWFRIGSTEEAASVAGRPAG